MPEPTDDMAVKAADPDRQIRPFADVLLELNGGASHAELSEGLNELVQAVKLYGKSGSLTLTIKVRPAGRSQSTVMLTDEVKVKIPEGERGESVFFVDAAGNLTRTPPGQERLPLREVPGGVMVDLPDADQETGEMRG